MKGDEYFESGDFKMDGMPHTIDNRSHCCSIWDGGICPKCGFLIHRESTYGGYYDLCPICDIGAEGMKISKEVIETVESKLAELNDKGKSLLFERDRKYAEYKTIDDESIELSKRIGVLHNFIEDAKEELERETE